jgi:hypothetical protein
MEPDPCRKIRTVRRGMIAINIDGGTENIVVTGDMVINVMTTAINVTTIGHRRKN